MDGISLGLLLVLLLVLAAEFVNGATDAPNAIATVVSTRVLSPRNAVVMATVLNAVGVMSGTAVAKTIGEGFIRADVVNLTTIGAAMVAIVVWSSLAWRYGLPTSETHALVASLTGAGFATGGTQALLWSGWKKVLIGLGLSTFLGFFGGLLLIVAIYWIFRRSSVGRVQGLFGRLQILSAGFMAFTHGSNDGQKFMGVFTLALVIAGTISMPGEFRVPWWVIVVCSLTMAAGTSAGGWRIIRTMGIRMVKLEPYQGFAAETAAASTIELASRLGIPVSTTHTISTAIVGVGAARGVWGVRWGVVREVVTAWILTFPVCAFIGWLVTTVVQWGVRLLQAPAAP
ncbi:MAG TPA: inorganic phosphate transporter [Tepidisphaeraceae bacterium]|nr:inorganic phosphate transporter [Tepidisphaeraceae bacterium]